MSWWTCPLRLWCSCCHSGVGCRGGYSCCGGCCLGKPGRNIFGTISSHAKGGRVRCGCGIVVVIVV